MIAGLKRYASYRSSGMSWLGEIPKHWKVVKLRHVLRHYSERNRPDLPLLSVVREKGVIRRDITNSDENHNFIPDDLSNYKVVRAGQFAMNKMKAWQGSYGVSRHDGIVSPAYFVFRIIGLDAEYFHIAIRSKAYVSFFTRASDGVRIGQWDLSLVRLREIPFATPPAAEQTAIVRFIDRVDRRISRYIRTKERLIELLEEQKQAIINQAVTGQMNVRTGEPFPSYRAFKPKWLTRLPHHWIVATLRSLSESIQTGPFGSQLHQADYVSDGIPVVNPSHIVDGRIEPNSDVSVTLEKANRLKEHYIRPGDVLMARRGEMGRCAVATERHSNWICGTGSIRIRLDSTLLLSPYLALFLGSAYGRRVLTQISVGTTMNNLAAGIVGSIRLFVPPVVEQRSMVGHLRDATASIDRAIARGNEQIEVTKEYRTRLIADVVTGKVDVREAAGALPSVDPLDCGDGLSAGLDANHGVKRHGGTHPGLLP